MSGTPTISKGSTIPYTVIGGFRRDRIRKYPFTISVLVLNRGDRLFRAELLSNIEASGIGETLWVDGPEPSYDVDGLLRDFPDARFLLVKDRVSWGEMIDIGIAEARAPHVLCIWSDARISSIDQEFFKRLDARNVVCLLPIIRTSRGEPVPSIQMPQLRKGKLSLQFRTPNRDGENALFPFDYCGIYDKERFAQVGGYDHAITNPYWQKLDFGFRCHLWGESIRSTNSITIAYAGLPPVEDATPDESYKAFYLKNLAVHFEKEMGVLPIRKLPDYILHSGTGPFYAFKEFRQMREWVWRHRFRFRRGPREVAEGWGSP
jgi:hypothetical protein